MKKKKKTYLCLYASRNIYALRCILQSSFNFANFYCQSRIKDGCVRIKVTANNPNMNSEKTTFYDQARVFSTISYALLWHPIAVKHRQK